MKIKDKIEELERRIRELETRPVYVPQPIYVQPYYVPHPLIPYQPPYNPLNHWITYYGGGNYQSSSLGAGTPQLGYAS